MENWKSILALGVAGIFVTTLASAQGTTPGGTTRSDKNADKSDTMKSPATADDTKSGTMKADTTKDDTKSDTMKSGPMKSDDMKSDTMMKSGKHAAGGNREQVRAAQQALKDKGHDPGAIDGVMGPKTQAALKDIQKAEGIQDTGRLDAETMAKLGIEGRSGAAEPASPSASPRLGAGSSSSSSDASKSPSSDTSKSPSSDVGKSPSSGTMGSSSSQPSENK